MYTPDPINTENIILSDELLALTEKLAANVHENWAAARVSQSWSYGPVRDDAKKETPCLLPYDQLPEEEKEYDRRSALESLKTIIALGYRIEKDDSSVKGVIESKDDADTIAEQKLAAELDEKFTELFGEIEYEPDNSTNDEDLDMDDSDYLDNTIIMTDENGEDVPFEFLDLIEYEGDEYVVLLSQDDDDSDEDGSEVVILKVDNAASDNEEAYISVDDEDILNELFDIFKKKYKDEFNFTD